VTVAESPSDGVPSSSTRTTIGYSPGPCASLGVHVNTPLTGSIAAPAGALAPRANVSAWAGRFESDAVAVKVRRDCSGGVNDSTTCSAGATFAWRISNRSLSALAVLPAASIAVTRIFAVVERVSGTFQSKLPEFARFAATAYGQVAPSSVEDSMRTESTPDASVATQVIARLVPIVHTSSVTGAVTSTAGGVLSMLTEAAGAAATNSGVFAQSRIFRLSTVTVPVAPGSVLFKARWNNVPFPVGPQAAPSSTPSTTYVPPPRSRFWNTVVPSAFRNVPSVMLAVPAQSSSPGESVNVTL
jgi:hypothetical protein